MVYDLIGEISSSSDEENELEDYLIGGGAQSVEKKSEGELPNEITLKPQRRKIRQDWNRSARIGGSNETARGWLKKSEKRRNQQKHSLRRKRPGVTALREIKFYQKCRTFLIPKKSFCTLVRKVQTQTIGNFNLRWQSVALFVLQGAAKAYMSGFFMDANLCALHRHVITIAGRDIWLAIQLRGREHLGGKPNVSDTGMFNTGEYFVSDPTEKQRFKLSRYHRLPYETTELQDWNKLMIHKSAESLEPREKLEGAKRFQRTRRNRVIPSMAALARLARRGGVKRIARSVYPEVRGVLVSFLEVVLTDVQSFVEYKNRRTVTAIDVVFALKRHGRNLYGYPQ